MFLLGGVALAVVMGLASLLFLQFRWHWYPLQYLFFLRAPIAFASLLVASPLLAVNVDASAPNGWRLTTWRNLFVLEPFGLALTSFLAILTAWTIVHAARWVYAQTPMRLQLTLRGYGPKRVPARNRVRSDHAFLRHLGYAGLAVPLVICATALSPGSPVPRASWAFGGVLFAFVLRGIVLRAPYEAVAHGALVVGDWIARPPRLLFRWMGRIRSYRSLEWSLRRRLLGARARSLDEAMDFDPPSVALTRANLAAFLPVTLAVYLLLWTILWPERRWPPFLWLQDQVPALAYVLLLTMLVCWGLSWFSLRLDKFRIPAELAAALVVFFVYWSADTDHTYAISGLRCGEVASTLTPAQYLSTWMAPPRPPGTDLVVVAASGGGISAAYWTATVLTQLQTLFPHHFSRSLAFISTTSGGSVGAMYYIAGFGPDATTGSTRPPQDLSAITESAGRSSLGAMGWGMIYPDFIRLVLPPLAFGSDRGWAIERRWAQRLPDPPPTLRSWEADVRAGWRPAIVFNATLTETGGRLLISPLELPSTPPGDAASATSPEPWRAESFVRLYPGADLAVVTAARLSSTFPYVTPVARPSVVAECPHPAYHVADGGYFDNFSVMTVVDFLRGVLPNIAAAGRRVLIVEIRASDSTQRTGPRLGEGFRLEVMGPADTLMAVRGTSQLERNQLELALLRELWRTTVESRPAVFELRADTPLSWHLSSDERESIRKYWDARCDHNQRALAAVAAFFKVAEPPAPPGAEAVCTRPERRPGAAVSRDAA